MQLLPECNCCLSAVKHPCSLCTQGKAPRSAAVVVAQSEADAESAAQLLSQAARPFCAELEELFLVLTMWVSPQHNSDEQHTER